MASEAMSKGSPSSESPWFDAGDFWTSLVLVARKEHITTLTAMLKLTSILERECARKRILRGGAPSRERRYSSV